MLARRFSSLLPLLSAAVCLASGHARADPIAEHFRGKQVSVVVGYDPGGAYDVYIRLLTKFIGGHVPGAPTFIMQFMPGAGSLRAANFVANVAPKDGTTLGVFSAPSALEPLFGNTAAQFDPLALNWIGNMYRDIAACATWKDTGIASLDQLARSDKETVFGATGPGSFGNQHALLLKDLLGIKLRIITGYKGVKDVNLAMQRNEVQVACAMNLSTLKAAFNEQLQSGDMKLLVQLSKTKHPYLGAAPSIYDVLRSEGDRAVVDLFVEQVQIARPLIAPPGVAAPIVAALRKAMLDALDDKALRAEAARVGIDIDPVSGEDTAAVIAALTRTPPAVVARAKTIMGRS